MIKALKTNLKKTIASFIRLTSKTRIGSYFIEQTLVTAMNNTRLVRHQSTDLLFSVPNRLNQFRADSFSTKEPETLEWIDKIPRGAVLWDIGANVGLYSCYAAKTRDCQVFAFEPSVFNLELLARNISLNQLTPKIAIVPLPLCEHLMLSTLNMTSMEWGGALSTFGKDYGWDGEKIEQVFAFQTLGVTMDGAHQHLGIPIPSHIKIDVDGIEHLVLKGGASVLQTVKGLLIEINDSFQEQADYCQKILTDAGLRLSEKRHSEMFGSADSFGGGQVWNQIWTRLES